MFRAVLASIRIRSLRVSYASDEISHHSLGFKSDYDEVQTEKILSTVNKFSHHELKNFDISNVRIKKLVEKREKGGNYKSVEDLLELDGFGIKVLEKFCNSILKLNAAPELNLKESEVSTEETLEAIKKGQFLTPVMLDIVRDSINSVVSFHVDLSYFAWTKFYYNRSAIEKLEEPRFVVEGWKCYDLRNNDKKLRLSDLIELLVKLNDQIPQADAYVIESLPIAVQARQPGSALQVNLNIQKTQLVAMLGVLMASRCSMNNLLLKNRDNENREDTAKMELPFQHFESVYFLRNLLPSRFYRILVGNERVSSAAVINKIIDYNHTVINPLFDPTLSFVNISDEYKYYFRKSNRIHSEYLGNSMLTGLTFLKLCVDRCKKSIASLNRSNLKPKV